MPAGAGSAAAPAHAAGHTHCLNCGTKLEGAWCHRCGQHDFDFHRSFGHVLLEALENFFHFDAKLFRNIVTLLFQPGRLSADFNAGKRASQVPPFRLYLFIAFVFFLLNLGRVDQSNLVPESEAKRTFAEIDRQLRNPGAPAPDLAGLDPEFREAIAEAVKEARAAPGLSQEAQEAIATEKIRQAAEKRRQRGKPGNTPALTIVPPKVDGAPQSDFDRFLLERSRYMLEHQREIAQKFMDHIPHLLLMCLPCFALLTRLLWRKSGLVYLQHLIIALHFHTFIYLWLMVFTGWALLFREFVPFGLHGWVRLGGALWLALYPLLMLRHAFGQGWLKTLAKTLLLALGYTLVIAGGFVVVGLLLLVLG